MSGTFEPVVLDLMLNGDIAKMSGTQKDFVIRALRVLVQKNNDIHYADVAAFLSIIDRLEKQLRENKK